MKRLINRVLFYSLCLLIIFLIASCDTTGAKLKALNETIDSLNEEINSVFIQTREISDKNRKILEDLVNNRDQYDLSFDKYEDKFTLYQDFLYYHQNDEGWGTIWIYLWPEFREDPSFLEKGKETIALFMNGVDQFMENDKELKYKTSTYYFTDDMDVFVDGKLDFYDPVVTVAPNFPKGILRMVYEWYSISIPENNPDKKGNWTKDAFVSVDGTGWIWSYSTPFYNKSGKFEGVTTKDVFILSLRDLIKDNDKDNLVFLSSSLTVLGLSQLAKETLKLEELSDHDYVALMQANEFAQDNFKLNYEKNSSGIQNIAQKISQGETEFEQEIEGKQFIVSVSKLSELDFYIIGLLPTK